MAQRREVKLDQLVFTLALLPLFSVPVAADENAQTVKADDIVVTATRTETSVDDAPASVTVIPQEEIKKYNVNSLVDALKHVNGLYVTNSSMGGDVSMRGLEGSSRTLVMVNGTPVNDGYNGGQGWNTMSIDNVERIEVIRGSGGSSLYGGNAMGGVVNIITAKPDKREGAISAGFGSDNTYKYSGYAGDRYGKFRVRLGYESSSTDGYPENIVASKVASGGGGTLSGGYKTTYKTGDSYWVSGDTGDVEKENTNLNIMTSYDLTDTGGITLDVQRGTDERKYGNPNTYLTDSGKPAYSGIVNVDSNQRVRVYPYNFLASTPVTNNENYLTSLAYKEVFGPVAFTAKAGYRTTDTWYTGRDSSKILTDFYDTKWGGTKKDYGTETWTSEMQGDVSVANNHLLTMGTSFRSDTMHMDEYTLSYYRDENSTTAKTGHTEGKDRFFGFFLQDGWSVTQQVTLYGGTRIDIWTSYDGVVEDTTNGLQNFEEHDDSSISPHVAVVWNPMADTFVRGSVGHAFRPPTIYELYRTMISSSGKTYHSNPELGPETSWNYEIGIDQYFFNRILKISSTGFYIQAEDFISSYDSEDGKDSYKENIGEAEVKGIELGITVNPFEWLDVWANYSLADSEVKENNRNPLAVGKHLTDYPENTFNTGFDIKYKQIKASLVGNYTGRMYVNDMNDDIEGSYGGYDKHWLWDTKLTCSPVKYVDISFSINNIFDEEYFNTSTIAPERTYFLEMKVKF